MVRGEKGWTGYCRRYEGGEEETWDGEGQEGGLKGLNEGVRLVFMVRFERKGFEADGRLRSRWRDWICREE